MKDDAPNNNIESISIVVPVYRAGVVLHELHSRIISVLEKLAGRFEIIFVEDCGGDNSWDVINQLAMKDYRVRGIKMSRNYGQHNALLCGIRSARNDVVITLDDDLQTLPEEIPKLLDKLAEGHEVVYGSRLQERHGWLRDMASQVTKWILQSAMGADNARNVSPMRAFYKRIRAGFDSYSSPYVNIDVLLTWSTNRFGFVPVRHDARAMGRSGYSFKKLVDHALNMITGFSALPLRIASLSGLLLAIFGVGIFVYVVIGFFANGNPVTGFPFLTSMIAMISGIQLFAVGVIGEYIARIHFSCMDKPAYFVEEEIGGNEL